MIASVEQLSSGFAFVVILMLGVLASAGGVHAVDSGTSSDVEATSGLVEDAVNETQETTDDTTDTVESTTDGTTDTVESATDAATDTISSTTDETTDTVDATTDSTTNAVDSTTDTVGSTTDGSTDTIESSTDSTTGTIESAADGTTKNVDETVDDSAEIVDDTVNETANTVDDTVNETTDTLDDTVYEGTDTVGTITGLDAPADDDAVDGTEGGDRDSDERDPEPHHEAEDDRRGEAEGSAAEKSSERTDSIGAQTAGPGSDLVNLSSVLLLVFAQATPVAAATSIGTSASNLSFDLTRRWGPTVSRTGRRRPWDYIGSILRYSRYDDSDPLDHDDRRSIFEAINGSPGVNLTGLARSHDVPLSTARHHLQILEVENLIRTEKIRGKRRYFPVDVSDVTLAAALSDPPRRRLLEKLATLGAARNDELARELDRDPSTITHHLSSLEEDGLVERERVGRIVVNQVAPAARSRLIPDETTAVGESD